MPTKSKGPIRVGIIGQGRSGLDIHARWFTHSPRKYKIVAVSDLLRDRRQRAQDELHCDAYANYKDLLARDDIELVVNSLPSHLHPKGSIEALQAGRHVVCEKPLSWRVAELDNVIAAARKARRRLMPYQQSRYAAHFQKLLAVIDSGVLGRIVQVNLSYSRFARRWDWQTVQEYRGGNLLNTGPHPMDQAMRLLDFKKPNEILCVMDRANTFGDAEDHVKILMRTKGKPTIDLEISSCCTHPRPMFTVYGTQGGLSGGPGGLEWKFFNPKKTPKQKLQRSPLPGPNYCREELKMTTRTWAPGKAQQNNFSYMSKCFYDNLYKTLREGTPLVITPQQVRPQIAVIEECHRQNRLSKMPAKGWPGTR